MKKHLPVLIAVFLSLAILGACSFIISEQPLIKKLVKPQETSLSWQEVSPGLFFSPLTIPGATAKDNKELQIIKIDPKQNSFEIYQNTDRENAKNIKEIHLEQNSLLTFNGNFFTEDFKPTGLLISQKKSLRKLAGAGLLNGIFTLDNNNNPRLYSYDDFPKSGKSAEDFHFAIQNGPVLLDDRGNIQITSETGKSSSRTIIGIDKDKNVILLFIKPSLFNTDNTITLYSLTHLLKENPELAKLGLHSVLNLDGGTSTGFMVKDDYYPEFEKVQNVVMVKPKAI